MTLGELYDAVAYLGFETRLEEEAVRRGFYAALNRAIETVAELSPVLREVRITHVPRKRLPLSQRAFVHEGGGEEVIPLPEGTRSVSMHADGPYRILLRDAAGEQLLGEGEGACTLTASPEGEAFLVLRDGARGAFRYTVGELCAFADRMAESDTGGEIRYPMRRYLPRFVAFASPRLLSGERVITQGFRLEGDSFFAGEALAQGEYVLLCREGHVHFGEGDARELALPLDEELCNLLPELIASYLWLDDAPEKAAYYQEIYRRGYAMAAKRRRSTRRVPIETNGW